MDTTKSSASERLRITLEDIRRAENIAADHDRRDQFATLNDPLTKIGTFKLGDIKFTDEKGITVPVLEGVDEISHGLQQWPDQLERFDELRKSAVSMGERLKIALMPEYFNKIGIVELALTREPDNEYEILEMEGQYCDLLEWYEGEGRSLEVLPVSPTNTLIRYWPSVLAEHSSLAKSLSIVELSQRLARGDVPTNDGKSTAHIQIINSRLFGVPKGLMDAFEIQFGEGCFENDDNARQVEAIDLFTRFIESEQGKKLINPNIRQSYLLQTFPKES